MTDPRWRNAVDADDTTQAIVAGQGNAHAREDPPLPPPFVLVADEGSHVLDPSDIRLPSGKTLPVRRQNLASGWRAAPDCGRCGDACRVTTRAIPEREITGGLLDEMAELFLRNYVGKNSWIATRAGLAAVLEIVLAPQVVDAHCTCKRGRRASAIRVAEKYGVTHPDASDPEPDDCDAYR
ncbi:hypothetical protein [Nonomuraea recticatena]|uniref:hypothetical protein n=1 Tax=Nonomuraea recticatena TaxID=46178 RepID=UPI0031F80DB5